MRFIHLVKTLPGRHQEHRPAVNCSEPNCQHAIRHVDSVCPLVPALQSHSRFYDTLRSQDSDCVGMYSLPPMREL